MSPCLLFPVCKMDTFVTAKVFVSELKNGEDWF